MNEHKEPWQRGNESNMTSIDRLIHHEEWLKKQHKDVRDSIHSKNEVEEKPVQGFVKD